MIPSLKEIIAKTAQHSKLVVAEDYEIGAEEIERTQSSYAEDTAHNERAKEYLITLRILHRKRLGESHATSFDKESLHHLVEDAFLAAENSLPDPWFRFPIWREQKPLEETSKFPETSELAKLFDEGFEWEYRRQISHRMLQRKTEKRTLEQTEKTNALKISCKFSLGNETFEISRKLKNFLSVEPVSKLVKNLSSAKRIYSQAEKYDWNPSDGFILGPAVCSKILSETAVFYEADRREGKKSLEYQALAPFTLIDDPSPQGTNAAFTFDREGAPRQCTEIISQGKFVSLLHSAATAARENRASTGNLIRFDARQGLRISFSNLILKSGDSKIENLVKEMHEGVFIEAGANWTVTESLENPLLIFDAFGWKIEEGAGNHPVLCEKVRVPLKRFLPGIEQVADNFEWNGDVGSPAVKLRRPETPNQSCLC